MMTSKGVLYKSPSPSELSQFLCNTTVRRHFLSSRPSIFPKEQTAEMNPMETSAGHVQKQKNHFQASAAHAGPRSGHGQRGQRWTQAPPYIQGHFQNPSAGPRQPPPPEFHARQMNQVYHQVDDLRYRLQKKNTFLTQEKEMRIAVEKDYHLQMEKTKELEKVLDVERHLRLVCVQELNRITDNLHKSIRAPEAGGEGTTRSEEAHRLVLQDLENLKKKLQDNSNLETASQPRPRDEFSQEQVNNLLLQVKDLTSRLQDKDNLLAEEKEKRLAADKKLTGKEEELQEMEHHLIEEYHRRIVSEKDLKRSKCTVDDLRLSLKTRSAEALKELEDVKKQLQEKTVSNAELTSKGKAQEEAIKQLELKVEELSEQIKSASETINHQPEVCVDTLDSSTQTKASASKDVSDVEEISTQTEDFQPEDVPESKEFSTQTEASLSEDVSDLKDVSIHQLEVVDEICESEESEESLPTNGQSLPQKREVSTSDPDPETPEKPSLFRRFKKFCTPEHRRQHKSRRQTQNPPVSTNIPPERERLPPEEQQRKDKKRTRINMFSLHSVL